MVDERENERVHGPVQRRVTDAVQVGDVEVRPAGEVSDGGADLDRGLDAVRHAMAQFDVPALQGRRDVGDESRERGLWHAVPSLELPIVEPGKPGGPGHRRPRQAPVVRVALALVVLALAQHDRKRDLPALVRALVRADRTENGSEDHLLVIVGAHGGAGRAVAAVGAREAGGQLFAKSTGCEKKVGPGQRRSEARSYFLEFLIDQK